MSWSISIGGLIESRVIDYAFEELCDLHVLAPSKQPLVRDQNSERKDFI
jgi:hypothetical protein